MFDPEKIARYENGPSNYALSRDDVKGDYVAAEDYDQLLELYRKSHESQKSLVAQLKDRIDQHSMYQHL